MPQNSLVPQHRKVYEILRSHISEGVFREGDLLPSENELCTVHKVTRPTIRKALDRLTNEGYIVRHQGKGSIVKGIPKGVGILSMTGTTSAIGQDNLLTHIVIKPEIRNWSEAITFPLRQREIESGCIYMERLRLVNINLSRFTSRNFENKSLFDILRKYYQVEVRGGEQKLLAIVADDRLKNYFQVESGHPVLQLNRKIETNRPGFYIYSQVFCNTVEYALYGTF